MSFFPSAYNFADIHRVDACREIGIHLLGCITLEILRFKGCSIPFSVKSSLTSNFLKPFSSCANIGMTAIDNMATNAVIIVLFFIFMYAITINFC